MNIKEVYWAYKNDLVTLDVQGDKGSSALFYFFDMYFLVLNQVVIQGSSNVDTPISLF
jgi:hypothetical protein